MPIAKEVTATDKKESKEFRAKDFPAVPVLEANTAYQGFLGRREGRGTWEILGVQDGRCPQEWFTGCKARKENQATVIEPRECVHQV